MSHSLFTPLQSFIHAETSRGVLLLLASLIALGWINSPFSASYAETWSVSLGFMIGDFVLKKSLLHWINDGLMAVFFLVVGLELKREVLAGELNTLRRAALPVAGALGGMIIPAVLYAAVNTSGDAVRGWGIPMATDIAFSLGILSLLGSRVPIGLKIFLTTLAVADDLGAILVIALFYTSDISWVSLVLGLGFLTVMILANTAGIRHPFVYGVLGIGGVWLAFLFSGIHPTVAGVLAAWTIPASPGSDAAPSPLHRLEDSLHLWVSTVILPLFALANAGVEFNMHASAFNSVTLGVALGLLIGKPVGITLAAWVAVRFNVACLPSGVTWTHIHAVSWLAGVGFTMSLFIGNLAFSNTPLLLVSAKMAILVCSLLAGFIGTVLLRRLVVN